MNPSAAGTERVSHVGDKAMVMNMGLRRRILLGYVVPLLLMLGVAAAVYSNIGTLVRISADLDRSHDVVEQVKNVHLGLVQMQRSARGYVIAKNPISRKNYDSAQALTLQRLRGLGEIVHDATQKENLQRLVEFSRQLAAEEQKYIELVDGGAVAQAQARFRNRSVNMGAELDALVIVFDKREAQITAARHEAERRAMEQLKYVAVGATALALLLCLVSGYWISGKISRSIGEAIAGMSTSSTEIAATVDEHERTVVQQAAAVNETTSTVEELDVSSRQSAMQAESMAEAAKRSLDATQEGTRLANQVSTSMTAMKQKVSSVTEQILLLSEQAGQIGGIARVVGELAGETNMLALNAAVEAARAGEHGKGFAVVAAEIRKLADQSKKSAERANALVAEIQKATNSAVMVTEEGSATAGEVANIIARTIEAFGAISATANSVSVGAQQVLLNSRQQAAALGQVTEAMKSLAAGATQMAAGTAQTKIGVQKLNGVALDLKAMV